MFHEGIMFLGSCLGEGLEPVAVVACAVVDSPAFHAFGHGIGHLARQRFLIVDGVDKGIECFRGKILEHLLAVEHILPVIGFGTFFGNFHRLGLAVEGFVDNFES